MQPAAAAFRQTAPEPGAQPRAGLAQQPTSRRTGIGPKCPAGEGRGECIVMDLRRKFGRRDAGIGRNIDGQAAAEAVAAAGKSLVMPMLMLRFGFPVMVGVLLGTRRAVSDVQMKRSVGVAAGESERQQ